MLRRRLPALLAALVVLAVPAIARAVTGPEFVAAADRICKKPAAQDVRLYVKAIRTYNRGRERQAAHLFIQESRLVTDWVSLQRASAKSRIAFARAVLSRKPAKTLLRLDAAARHQGMKAAKAGGKIGFQECPAAR